MSGNPTSFPQRAQGCAVSSRFKKVLQQRGVQEMSVAEAVEAAPKLAEHRRPTKEETKDKGEISLPT